jgi:hypothetical protein
MKYWLLFAMPVVERPIAAIAMTTALTVVAAPHCVAQQQSQMRDPRPTVTCDKDVSGRVTCFMPFMQEGKTCALSDRADMPICKREEQWQSFEEQQKKLQEELKWRTEQTRTSIERWAAQPVAETHDGPPADPNMSQKQLEDRKPWKDDRLDPRVFQKSIEQ